MKTGQLIVEGTMWALVAAMFIAAYALYEPPSRASQKHFAWVFSQSVR